MLDQPLRRRLHALAHQDTPVLDGGARARILQHVVAAAPLEIRRAERVRWVKGGSVALAAAAAAALVFGLGTDALRTPGSPSVAASPEATPTPLPAAPSRACANSPLPTAFVERAGGMQVLELGGGQASANASSRVNVERVEPCRTLLVLDAGRLVVRAPDLRGGELTVRTRDADVVSHGAVFAIAQGEREVTLEVAEGRVMVDRHAMGKREVVAGRRVALSPSVVVESQLEPGDTLDQ
jgi:ferric-dicitrate binding protein FerR (iron transport regulator)